MAKRTLSVTTPHGTFLRTTDNVYTVIAVGVWGDGVTVGTTWHRSLANARKAPRFARVLGFYSVADGSQVAPGLTITSATERRAARTAPTPAPAHEFERCAECDRRHDPARVRCGNCWRCHEPAVKCATTRKEIADSIERHNTQPTFFRVLTNQWRPWNEAAVPQCACHTVTQEAI